MPADLLLLFARLLVCTVFIVSAVDKFNLVPAEVAAMRALKLPAPLFLMRLTGVCEIVGCLMLGLGIGPAPYSSGRLCSFHPSRQPPVPALLDLKAGCPRFSAPTEHLLQQSRDDRGAPLRRRGGARSLFADVIAGIKEE